jgi:putative endonuclease
MGNRRRDTGRLGEALASSYLERKGYCILARNYRCRLGEVDLITRGPDGLVFVEVRTKRHPAMVTPEETIGRVKADRMIRSAEHYLMETGQEELRWRLDVIAIELGEGGDPVRIEHYQDAVSDILGL